LNLSANIPLNFVAVQQMTAEGQSDKMASDMEVRMKQRYIGIHIKYPLLLSDFNETRIFSTYIPQILKYQFEVILTMHRR